MKTIRIDFEYANSFIYFPLFLYFICCEYSLVLSGCFIDTLGKVRGRQRERAGERERRRMDVRERKKEEREKNG